MNEVTVIGGGFAGVEAAWQAARLGAHVRLYEMRPVKQTPAHRTDKLAEIVCSNSLKSDEPGSAPYLLKEELRRAGSLVMDAAEATRVPAGAALAVDRHRFAELITERIESEPLIEIVREEVTRIPERDITIIATGPLSSETLINSTFTMLSLQSSPPTQLTLVLPSKPPVTIKAATIISIVLLTRSSMRRFTPS